VDLAIDSVDGVSLVAKGLSQALSIAAAAEPRIAKPPPAPTCTSWPWAGPGAIDIADTPANTPAPHPTPK